jgi:hypothetical protein
MLYYTFKHFNLLTKNEWLWWIYIPLMFLIWVLLCFKIVKDENNPHSWVIFSSKHEQCIKCKTKKFLEPNHGKYVWVYYSPKNNNPSLKMPKCIPTKNNYKEKIK